jgi:YARHG domain
MSESGSGRQWVLVTLVAALIGSPLLLRYFEKHGVIAPEQSKISVEFQMPPGQLVGGSDPAVQTARSLSIPIPTTATAAAPSAPAGTSLDTRGRYLTTADLTGLSRWDLDVLRNEIYARYGRRFKRGDLQAYFDQQTWYKPIYPANAFPEEMLSAVERWNAEFISDFQRSR